MTGVGRTGGSEEEEREERRLLRIIAAEAAVPLEDKLGTNSYQEWACCLILPE
jgi:hypothetical protein